MIVFLRLCALCVLITASGCTTGVAMVAMNGFGYCSPTSFKQAQFKSGVLRNIYVGQPVSSFASRVGAPDKTRKIQTVQGEAELWEYRLGSEYCRNTSEETIVVISQNGVVQGVGEGDYKRLKTAQSNYYPTYY